MLKVKSEFLKAATKGERCMTFEYEGKRYFGTGAFVFLDADGVFNPDFADTINAQHIVGGLYGASEAKPTGVVREIEVRKRKFSIVELQDSSGKFYVDNRLLSMFTSKSYVRVPGSDVLVVVNSEGHPIGFIFRFNYKGE